MVLHVLHISIHSAIGVLCHVVLSPHAVSSPMFYVHSVGSMMSMIVISILCLVISVLCLQCSVQSSIGVLCLQLVSSVSILCQQCCWCPVFTVSSVSCVCSAISVLYQQCCQCHNVISRGGSRRGIQGTVSQCYWCPVFTVSLVSCVSHVCSVCIWCIKGINGPTSGMYT